MIVIFRGKVARSVDEYIVGSWDGATSWYQCIGNNRAIGATRLIVGIGEFDVVPDGGTVTGRWTNRIKLLSRVEEHSLVEVVRIEVSEMFDRDVVVS